jgi:hypothetical protein
MNDSKNHHTLSRHSPPFGQQVSSMVLDATSTPPIKIAISKFETRDLIKSLNLEPNLRNTDLHITEHSSSILAFSKNCGHCPYKGD